MDELYSTELKKMIMSYSTDIQEEILRHKLIDDDYERENHVPELLDELFSLNFHVLYAIAESIEKGE